MDISEAIEQAERILDEERVRPTIKYHDAVVDWLTESVNQGYTNRQMPPEISERFVKRKELYSKARLNISTERNKQPRPVHEYPDEYEFQSENFDLLRIIFTQIPEADRVQFISTLLMRIPRQNTHHDLEEPRFPTYNGNMSDLPLLAEFVIRMGHLQALIDALNSAETPTIGIVLLFYQLEELIALNFNVFSDSQLEALASDLRPIWDRSRKIEMDARKTTIGPRLGSGTSGHLAQEINESIGGIAEECRSARYFYLRGQLRQQSPNLEIESDKTKVESFLVKLGFSDDMVKVLNAAESDYKSTATAFELKNCLSHLRSFLEHLHRESVKSIATNAGDTVTDRWGHATSYLRQKGYFTTQHEIFVTSLYTLISDESVHPLGADREYARLLRNMVIEYGVMFLSVLDKKGVNLRMP